MYAIALTASERELIERAVHQLVRREGPSQTAADVLALTSRPLRVEELAGLEPEVGEWRG